MSLSDTLQMLWAWTPFLGEGFLWNILISAVTMAIGTPAGYLLARARLAGSRLAAWLTAAARVPPTFVLIYYLAYVLPPEFAVGGLLVPLPHWLKASLALSVAVAGFVSDNALSALRHRLRGERVEALYFIPAWTTYFLIIVMASSTASVIGVPEIVQRANTVIAAVGEPGAILPVYLFTMLWFLLFCWPLARLMRHAKLRLASRAGSEAGARIGLSDRSGAAEASLLPLPAGDAEMGEVSAVQERFEVPVSLESIPKIQARLEAAGEGVVEPAAVFRLSVAVDELVTNMVHYGDATLGDLEVAILSDAAGVGIELSAPGEAFDPFRDAPPPKLDEPVETRQVGGLGIHLVTEMVDRAFYSRIGERNVIRLIMLRPGVPTGGIVP